MNLADVPMLASREEARVRWTWEALVEAEPRLAPLEADLAVLVAAYAAGPFCANAVWYGYGHVTSPRDRLTRLVGWESEQRRLRYSQPYDVAYDHLSGSLPDCAVRCACQRAAAGLEARQEP